MNPEVEYKDKMMHIHIAISNKRSTILKGTCSLLDDSVSTTDNVLLSFLFSNLYTGLPLESRDEVVRISWLNG